MVSNFVNNIDPLNTRNYMYSSDTQGDNTVPADLTNFKQFRGPTANFTINENPVDANFIGNTLGTEPSQGTITYSGSVSFYIHNDSEWASKILVDAFRCRRGVLNGTEADPDFAQTLIRFPSGARKVATYNSTTRTLTITGFYASASGNDLGAGSDADTRRNRIYKNNLLKLELANAETDGTLSNFIVKPTAVTRAGADLNIVLSANVAGQRDKYTRNFQTRFEGLADDGMGGTQDVYFQSLSVRSTRSLSSNEAYLYQFLKVSTTAVTNSTEDGTYPVYEVTYVKDALLSNVRIEVTTNNNIIVNADYQAIDTTFARQSDLTGMAADGVTLLSQAGTTNETLVATISRATGVTHTADTAPESRDISQATAGSEDMRNFQILRYGTGYSTSTTQPVPVAGITEQSLTIAIDERLSTADAVFSNVNYAVSRGDLATTITATCVYENLLLQQISTTQERIAVSFSLPVALGDGTWDLYTILFPGCTITNAPLTGDGNAGAETSEVTISSFARNEETNTTLFTNLDSTATGLPLSDANRKAERSTGVQITRNTGLSFAAAKAFNSLT